MKYNCMCYFLNFIHAYIFFRLSWMRCIWAVCTLPPRALAQCTWATGFRVVRQGRALALAMLPIVRRECTTRAEYANDAHMASQPSLRCTSHWREKLGLGAAMSCLWLVWYDFALWCVQLWMITIGYAFRYKSKYKLRSLYGYDTMLWQG